MMFNVMLALFSSCKHKAGFNCTYDGPLNKSAHTEWLRESQRIAGKRY